MNLFFQDKESRQTFYIFCFTSILLFACSSIRHLLFKSNAFDLGIFDQAIFLISQFQEPFSSLMGFHILGDHAAWIHYLLALPYKIYPSVYWLFLIQAMSLSAGIFPTYYLSIDAGLKPVQAKTIIFVYLLYPVIFNANLFDFHPEVIAVPLILFAVLSARRAQKLSFCLSILFILGCKAVLSLTVIAMGIWLLLFEKRRFYGLFSLALGIFWFIISVKLIIPYFSGAEAAAVGRYSYLGDSVFEISRNLLIRPQLILKKLFILPNLEYLIYLILPIAWGISRKIWIPLMGTIPCIILNLLSENLSQKNLVLQYSLPVIPFLILGVIASLASNQCFIKNNKTIIIWSAISFLIFAKYTYFTSIYLEYTDNLKETREAIALIADSDGVYTNSQIVPHLSHRSLIRFSNIDYPDEKFEDFEYILLNMRHPGWSSDVEFIKKTIEQVQRRIDFDLAYQKEDVFLFTQKNKI